MVRGAILSMACSTAIPRCCSTTCPGGLYANGPLVRDSVTSHWEAVQKWWKNNGKLNLDALRVLQTEWYKILVGFGVGCSLFSAAASKNPTYSKKRNQMPWCVLSSLRLLVEPRLNNKLATQVRSQESCQDAPNSSRSKSDLPPADGVDSANKSEVGLMNYGWLWYGT